MAIVLINLSRFAISRQRRYLLGAFLVAGLALWYKAVFVFPLVGVLIALVAVYPQQVRQCLSLRNVLVGLAGLGIGSAPLIAFNFVSGGATLKAARDLMYIPLTEKVLMLKLTLDGGALEHYMVRSSFTERIPVSGEPLGNLVLSWYRHSHFLPGSLLLYFVALSLLALPFLRSSALFQPLLFAWVSLAATIGSMWILRDAGSGPHHTILIYPAPHFIVAATATALHKRRNFKAFPLSDLILTVLVLSNIWLLSEYYRAARENGFSVYWTGGMQYLGKTVSAQPLPVASLDWGIQSGLEIETHDRIPFLHDLTPRENVLFVSHCNDYVVDASRVNRFLKSVMASGLRITGRQTVPDEHGRPVFCFFRLARQAG
jgi:hypothetical protein